MEHKKVLFLTGRILEVMEGKVGKRCHGQIKRGSVCHPKNGGPQVTDSDITGLSMFNLKNVGRFPTTLWLSRA